MAVWIFVCLVAADLTSQDEQQQWNAMASCYAQGIFQDFPTRLDARHKNAESEQTLYEIERSKHGKAELLLTEERRWMCREKQRSTSASARERSAW